MFLLVVKQNILYMYLFYEKHLVMIKKPLTKKVLKWCVQKNYIIKVLNILSQQAFWIKFTNFQNCWKHGSKVIQKNKLWIKNGGSKNCTHSSKSNKNEGQVLPFKFFVCSIVYKLAIGHFNWTNLYIGLQGDIFYFCLSKIWMHPVKF